MGAGGLWRFTNVTRSTQWWPTIASLSLDDHRPLEVATLTCRVVDEDADQVFDGKDQVLVEFAPDGVTYGKVLAGDISVCGWEDMGRSDPRVYAISVVDFTSRLEDTLLTSARNVTESVTDRIAWIMGHTPSRGITTTNVASIATMLDPYDYDGMNRREALDQVANECDGVFYVDDDLDLHFFVGAETNPAPFDLVHPASPPDSYPFWDFSLPRDFTDYATRVRAKGDGVEAWAIDSALETALGYQLQRGIEDTNLTTLAQVTRAANVGLAKMSSPQRDGNLTMLQPGIRSGMQVRIAYPIWSLDETFQVNGVSIDYLEPNDEDDPETGGRAHFQVSFTDKVRRLSGARQPRTTTNQCYDVFEPDDGLPACNDVSDAQDFEFDVGPSASQILLWMAFIDANGEVDVEWSEAGEIWKGIGAEYPWHPAWATVRIYQDPTWTDPDSPPTVGDLPYITPSGTFNDPLIQEGGEYDDADGLALGWLPFAPDSKTYTITSGKWLVIWVNSYRQCENIGHPDNVSSPWPAAAGVRWAPTITLSDFTCPVFEPVVIGQVCSGAMYGPATLFPDDAGVYTFPYPFVGGSLQVLVGGTWQVPVNVDLTNHTFELAADPGSMIVQAYGQIPAGFIPS